MARFSYVLDNSDQFALRRFVQDALGLLVLALKFGPVPVMVHVSGREHYGVRLHVARPGRGLSGLSLPVGGDAGH